jgi:CRP-like cAMP-binding protein
MEKQLLISTIKNILPIPEEKILTIASHFKEKTIEKNDLLLKEGQICNMNFFLESGIMRAYTIDTEGNEITTSFFSNNEFVLEPGSMFQRVPSKESIQAIEDCTGYYITYDELQMLFHSLPEFRELGRAILVRGFINFKNHSISLINQTAEERYNHFMATRPNILQHAPLKHIATYLGITDTSLSRIRKKAVEK